jgi:hypothetical protein
VERRNNGLNYGTIPEFDWRDAGNRIGQLALAEFKSARDISERFFILHIRKLSVLILNRNRPESLIIQSTSGN